MLITNRNVRLYPHDRILGATIVRLVPRFVHPNHVTVLRLFLIPVVLYFIWIESWTIGFWLFLFTAFTDALDGTLARLRRQITLWGTMADPVADKLLVGSVAVLIVAREINVLFAAVIVAIELMIVAGAFYRKRKGIYSSANGYGKIKMVLQVVGLSFLLLARVAGYDLFVPFGVSTLSLAIVFALLSLFTYGI